MYSSNRIVLNKQGQSPATNLEHKNTYEHMNTEKLKQLKKRKIVKNNKKF